MLYITYNKITYFNHPPIALDYSALRMTFRCLEYSYAVIVFFIIFDIFIFVRKNAYKFVI